MHLATVDSSAAITCLLTCTGPSKGPNDGTLQHFTPFNRCDHFEGRLAAFVCLLFLSTTTIAVVIMSTSASNIVAEWLRSLQLGRYAESFLDNGYDDLEICKQVGDPDLDAIGVFEPSHRSRLLHSVRALREEGAASVYFTLEEAAAAAAAGEEGGGDSCLPQSSSLLVMSADGGRYRDEYEEGKAELVRIPRPQLRMLLRDTLDREGIRLSCRPYSTSDHRKGQRVTTRYSKHA
ncbi:sterile alpha motif domain-containing protein 5-like [Ischnura elegans]|uniref:sterile alpha motif domain-containing protein 5-like n=1 Tax=Ischnura elegans TaxID=197161 RepID=UPI001ED8A5A7|nr:sterile alpha motif domain-containing protein 5-like [Ischnura elegans]